MTGFSAYRPAVDEHGSTWNPWTDGEAVGFRIDHANGTTEYLYLNPSLESDVDAPTCAFVYQGTEGDPAQDAAYHFYNVANCPHTNQSINDRFLFVCDDCGEELGR